MEDLKEAVFLDRDGVINKVLMRDGKPCSPREIGEFIFLEGVEESIKRLKSRGLKLVVVTNQPDIARGKMTEEHLRLMTAQIYETLAVDKVIICPHDDYHGCDCRKPKPGMLIQASMDLDIDLRKSYIIGDSWKDMEAGKAVGCTTILIDLPYNTGVEANIKVQNLSSAVNFILSDERE